MLAPDALASIVIFLRSCHSSFHQAFAGDGSNVSTATRAEQHARGERRVLAPRGTRLAHAPHVIPSHCHQNSPQIRKFKRGSRACV